jgi:hypothetical protein
MARDVASISFRKFITQRQELFAPLAADGVSPAFQARGVVTDRNAVVEQEAHHSKQATEPNALDGEDLADIDGEIHDIKQLAGAQLAHHRITADGGRTRVDS